MVIDQYRKHIQNLLTERAQRISKPQNEAKYEVQTVLDVEQNHYQLL